MLYPTSTFCFDGRFKFFYSKVGRQVGIGGGGSKSEVTSRDVQRAKYLSASGKRPLFRSCEAMPFAVTWHLECVVLLHVSLFMVCHALRLECVKSTDATTSVHLALCRCLVHVASASSACGCGRPGVLLSVSAVNNSQLAFRKFHLLTVLPAISCTSDGTLMIDGRWCDRGNLSLMRRSGFGSQLLPTAKARSGLVYVFHRAEKKLGGSFGSYSSIASALDAQRLAVLCSLFTTPVCVLAVEVTCIDGWRKY